MAKKFAIQFQDADPVNKPLFWTGHRYNRGYTPYAELTSNVNIAKLYSRRSNAMQGLEAVRTGTANKGIYEIIQVEVEE